MKAVTENKLRVIAALFECLVKAWSVTVEDILDI